MTTKTSIFRPLVRKILPGSLLWPARAPDPRGGVRPRRTACPGARAGVRGGPGTARTPPRGRGWLQRGRGRPGRDRFRMGMGPRGRRRRRRRAERPPPSEFEPSAAPGGRPAGSASGELLGGRCAQVVGQRLLAAIDAEPGDASRIEQLADAQHGPAARGQRGEERRAPFGDDDRIAGEKPRDVGKRPAVVAGRAERWRLARFEPERVGLVAVGVEERDARAGERFGREERGRGERGLQRAHAADGQRAAVRDAVGEGEGDADARERARPDAAGDGRDVRGRPAGLRQEFAQELGQDVAARAGASRLGERSAIGAEEAEDDGRGRGIECEEQGQRLQLARMIAVRRSR